MPSSSMSIRFTGARTGTAIHAEATATAGGLYGRSGARLGTGVDIGTGVGTDTGVGTAIGAGGAKPVGRIGAA